MFREPFCLLDIEDDIPLEEMHLLLKFARVSAFVKSLADAVKTT